MIVIYGVPHQDGDRSIACSVALRLDLSGLDTGQAIMLADTSSFAQFWP